MAANAEFQDLAASQCVCLFHFTTGKNTRGSKVYFAIMPEPTTRSEVSKSINNRERVGVMGGGHQWWALVVGGHLTDLKNMANVRIVLA